MAGGQDRGTVVRSPRTGFYTAATAFATLLLMPIVATGQQDPRKLSESERQQCLAAGNHVAIMGLSGNEGCVHRMPDAGKRCTDGTQCKAGCYLDQSRPGFKYPSPKAKVAGVCAATDYGFGCRTAVKNGRAMPGLCVD